MANIIPIEIVKRSGKAKCEQYDRRGRYTVAAGSPTLFKAQVFCKEIGIPDEGVVASALYATPALAIAALKMTLFTVYKMAPEMKILRTIDRLD
jgi:hypothetical protein